MAEGPPGVSGQQDGAATSIAQLGPPPSIETNTQDDENELTDLNDVDSALSPTGSTRRAAPEPNKRALYVGGLDPRVTDEVLKQIFATFGHVQSVKIIPDKNVQRGGLNYGFVEFDDPGSAERAMANLNGRSVHGHEIRVNNAYQANNQRREDTTNHHHVFVGDLSNEVNDEILLQAFSTFGDVSEARVMWDMKTGRSRGFGFVAFRNNTDAEKAINAMNGEYLGARAIRVNWANQRGQPPYVQQQAMMQMSMHTAATRPQQSFSNGPQNYDVILQQTPQWQTKCYVGNISPYTSQMDLIPLFTNFGEVMHVRMVTDRGFAMITMDTHEHAANAIAQLNGYIVNGLPIKCGWGRDQPSNGQNQSFGNGPPAQTGFSQGQTGYFPQYSGPPAPVPAAAHGQGYGHAPHAYSQPYASPGYGAPPAANPGNAYHSGTYQGYSYRG